MQTQGKTDAAAARAEMIAPKSVSYMHLHQRPASEAPVASSIPATPRL
jgi:hypothetical protein